MDQSSGQRVEQDEHLAGEAAITRVRDLLSGFRAGMFVTLSADRMSVHARPLALLGDAAAFAGALRDAVADDVPASVERRMAIARQYDWSVQMAQMSAWMETALGARH